MLGELQKIGQKTDDGKKLHIYIKKTQKIWKKNMFIPPYNLILALYFFPIDVH